MELRFQTRITVVFATLFVVVLSVILFATYSSAIFSLREQGREQLLATARTFNQVMQERAASITTSAAILAHDPLVIEGIKSGDTDALTATLATYSDRLDADLALIIQSDNSLLAGYDRLGIKGNYPRIQRSLQWNATAENPAFAVVEQEGRLFQMSIVPIGAPVPIGWLVLGSELDLGAARSMKPLSALPLEVALIYRQGRGQWNLSVATDKWTDIEYLIRKNTRFTEEPGRYYDTPGGAYTIFQQELPTASALFEANMLLFLSVDTVMEGFRRLFVVLLSVAVGGLAILIIGSNLVARSVTKPLKALANDAKLIAQGDYHGLRDIAARDKEIADLANSFDRMAEAVAYREKRIVFQGSHDTSTGLLNRLGLEERLAPLLAEKRHFTIVAVELADMPSIRASLDFERIIDLLKAVGNRLEEVSGSVVARLANDMLYFYLETGGPLSEETTLKGIAAEFQEPIEIGGLRVDANLRFGVVRVPEHGEELRVLFRKTGLAIFKGRSAPQLVTVYDDSCDLAGERSLSMMSDLRAALKTQEVRFFYQPKIDLKTGRVSGVEALMRWFSAERGFVPPDSFIPLAERTGDISQITAWAIDAGLQQVAAWNALKLNLKMSINLSATDLINPDLAKIISTALLKYQVPSNQLVLEVTESAVMRDITRAISCLETLNTMGITISIDDYGTGYSSLSYLKRLPVQELKIDMSFIRKLASSQEDEILVRSTIDLGHNLGLLVVAEGVEDTRSVQILKNLGCDTAQGYYYSKPIPAEEIPDFIRSFSRPPTIVHDSA